MPRKKAANQENILSHFVRTRVTKVVYERLDKIKLSSDAHSIGEVARKLLSKEKITLFYKDITLNMAMEELALIRKELKAIGININQVTRGFNSDKREASQAFYVIKIAGLYKTVDAKVDRLLSVTNELAGKWLQK